MGAFAGLVAFALIVTALVYLAPARHSQILRSQSNYSVEVSLKVGTPLSTAGEIVKVRDAGYWLSDICPRSLEGLVVVPVYSTWTNYTNSPYAVFPNVTLAVQSAGPAAEVGVVFTSKPQCRALPTELTYWYSPASTTPGQSYTSVLYVYVPAGRNDPAALGKIAVSVRSSSTTNAPGGDIMYPLGAVLSLWLDGRVT